MANPGRACAECRRVEEVAGPLQTIATSPNSSSHVCADCMSKPHDETPVVAPIAAAPSGVSREMMRALADRLSMSLRVHRLSMSLRVQAGIVDGAIGEMIAGLYAGRYEVFLAAQERIRVAYEAIRASLDGVRTTEAAIGELDPTYHAAIAGVQAKIIAADVSRKVRELDVMTLAMRFATHTLGCTDKDCPETAAYHAEFKRRGMTPPRIGPA